MQTMTPRSGGDGVDEIDVEALKSARRASAMLWGTSGGFVMTFEGLNSSASSFGAEAEAIDPSRRSIARYPADRSPVALNRPLIHRREIE